ncbi:unnamed protein product [Paramecium primaurelia]|uniref:Major facilitator superfamily (MFS) profile domain-containing protein n=1 Tax=Paramecium primaurelia TaxID=5886 RepID=A0A8S1N6M4_PARPR|nr:unnamed protein product [Paramecium primaurelia]
MQKDSLLERKETLQSLNNAKFGWFHIKACLVSGIGFFTDAYDLFIIQLAIIMIGMVYYHDEVRDGDTVIKKADKLYPISETLLKQSALFGTLIGQLLFGYLADLLGRKKMYGTELLIIVFTTITSALAANTAAPNGLTIVGMLIIWRFLLGVGIGGDYPLSAIITSEFANTKNRGAMIAAVFAMQGFGILTGSIVSLLVLLSFSNTLNNDDPLNYLQIDHIWRIIVIFGAVPGLVAIYFRMTIPETPRFTMDIKGDAGKAKKNVQQILKNNSNDISEDNTSLDDNKQKIQKPTFYELKRYLSKWRNGKILLGTAMTWFALDIGFYGINLNQTTILKQMGFGSGQDLSQYEILKQAIYGNLITSALGTVPGYWLTVLFVDRWGRKTIQIMGFVALTILFSIMGLCKDILGHYLFITLYTLANLFNNFGPNATTFIIPGEVFPTRYRSTCHGISAASGKLGAIISQVWFLGLGADNFQAIMLVFAVFMGIGLAFTFLIPETKGKTLEEICEIQLKSSQIQCI